MNTTTISQTAAKVRPLKPQLPDEPGHTPGPWNVDYNTREQRYELRSPTGSFGHFVGWSADGVTTEQEDKANARLIAAAPDLLAALRFALRRMERLDAEHLGKDDACEAARAAIAKATGQP